MNERERIRAYWKTVHGMRNGFIPSVKNPCFKCPSSSECHACKYYVEWVYTTNDETLPIIDRYSAGYDNYLIVLDPFLPGVTNWLSWDDVNIVLDNQFNILEVYNE
jgi:hypothetical protein